VLAEQRVGHNLHNKDRSMVKPLGFIVVVSLLGMPVCAQAQGTSQQNDTRGGQCWHQSGWRRFDEFQYGSSVARSRNSGRTGQNRTEGLTPQHQKELGINKQQ
jgi:hypothetical protein